MDQLLKPVTPVPYLSGGIRVGEPCPQPGVCVNRRCLGSLLTLILTSATCTWGALVIALFPGEAATRIRCGGWGGEGVVGGGGGLGKGLGVGRGGKSGSGEASA